MGILREPEMRVIGCFPGDVSAYVTDQKGEEAVCFHSNVPSGAGSEILQTYFEYFATRGHYIIKVLECKDDDVAEEQTAGDLFKIAEVSEVKCNRNPSNSRSFLNPKDFS